jgi:hypothetical protein
MSSIVFSWDIATKILTKAFLQQRQTIEGLLLQEWDMCCGVFYWLFPVSLTSAGLWTVLHIH